MSQINIIVRTDSQNDLRKTLEIIQLLWNRHFAKSEGILVYSFLPYDPHYADKSVQELQTEFDERATKSK